MKTTIEQAVKALKEGKTILYPTDTVWGLGCDATNSEAVKKIYNIKQRSESKALIVLLPSLDAVANHVQDISPSIPEILEKAERPTTIIYPKAKNLAENLVAENGSIAIRMPNHDFCQQLLKAFENPNFHFYNGIAVWYNDAFRALSPITMHVTLNVKRKYC